MITSLFAIKVVAALAILVMGIVGGIIPLLVARHDTSRRFMSMGNALAGGIFLGAGFIHLLPEAGEALEELIDYPLAPLLVAVGVLVLLLIDRVLLETNRTLDPGQGEKTHQPIYPLILFVVLSIHSIIAGIALGLEAEVAASLLVMLAILFHKGSAAFALIVSVHVSGADRKRLWTVLTIFVLMTPLGIVFGMVASGFFEGRAALLIEGSFNALAAGTFIYIAILDIINVEMSRVDDRIAHFVRRSLLGDDEVAMPSHDTDRIFKFALVFVGLSSMAAIGIWV